MSSFDFTSDIEQLWNSRFPHASSIEPVGCLGDCVVAKYPTFYIKVYSVDNGLFTAEIWNYDIAHMIASGNLNDDSLSSFGRRCFKDDDAPAVSNVLAQLMVSDHPESYCNC